MSKPFAVVITSLLSDTRAIKMYSEYCPHFNSELFIVGDKKSRKAIKFDYCSYYSLQRQKKLPYKFAQKCPVNNYARKNIGYLEAIKSGYEIIVETDDDNYPKDSFWHDRKINNKCNYIKDNGWVNVYSYFSNKKIWPRGFPLELLKRTNPQVSKIDSIKNCPIQQGLVDNDPDVDAIYRMTIGENITFIKNRKLTLGKNVWCPFNSQNTTWFKKAFPLMYLPSFCNMRLTDIWRSFIAQRIAWTCGWNILFHSPNAYQDRNEHNLLSDFADELPGYQNNRNICNALGELELKEGVVNIYENLFRCYKLMIKNRWIGQKELKLLETWIKDLDSLP